ncbi:MAG: hypothetical protein HYU51_01085 [Candidatus Rokubacteria bacterium]|nr:hypothetical protein [Candidatus Rokubacteria bacterium]
MTKLELIVPVFLSTPLVTASVLPMFRPSYSVSMFRPSYSVRLMTPAFVNPLAAVSVADPAHGSPKTVTV